MFTEILAVVRPFLLLLGGTGSVKVQGCVVTRCRMWGGSSSSQERSALESKEQWTQKSRGPFSIGASGVRILPWANPWIFFGFWFSICKMKMAGFSKKESNLELHGQRTQWAWASSYHGSLRAVWLTWWLRTRERRRNGHKGLKGHGRNKQNVTSTRCY